MTSAVAEFSGAIDARSAKVFTDAFKAVSASGGMASMLRGGYSPSLANWNEMSQHAEQYRYFRGYVYTAIRPIMVRIASQAARVGIKLRPGAVPTKKGHRGYEAKDGVLSVGKSRFFLADKSTRDSIVRAAAWSADRSSSSRLRAKAVAEGMEVLEAHPLLDALEDPNEIQTQWHLMCCTVASLQLTGKAYWWLTDEEVDGETRLRIWPIPASWVRPIPSAQNLYAAWEITPPTGRSYVAPGRDICYYYYPDPADPLGGAVSPLQAQGRPVAISDYIDQSQVASFKQGPNPGMVVKAGQMTDMDGKPTGQKIGFTPRQRSDLIDTIRLIYGGVLNHGDPVILDALIDDVYPYTTNPTEMDYTESSKAAKSRIMQGFGTNPIVAGEIENANRASSYVADDLCCANVLNPLLVMMGQVATKRLAPRFATKGVKLYVWFDACQPRDADLELSRLQYLASQGWVSGDESREMFDMLPAGLDEYTAHRPPQFPPAARPQHPGAAV